MDVRNHSELHGYNTSLIFRIIHEQGPISRTEIVQRTGLSASTVTVITGELQQRGLIRECGYARSRGGRRPILLETHPAGGCFLCADLSGEGPLIAVVNLAMETVLHQGYSGVDMQGKHLYEVLQGALREARQWCVDRELPVLGVGIATPGLISAGRVVEADNLGWHDFDLKTSLERELKLPVLVENDSNAAAYGEYQYGSGRATGSRAMMFVSVDTGIGSGLVLRGDLYTGGAGMAGELGHVKVMRDGPPCTCGASGCLEAVASVPAILRDYQRASGGCRRLDLETLCRQAEEADEPARTVIAQAARLVGEVIGNHINMLNVDTVVMGGRVTMHSPLFYEAAASAVKQNALPLFWRQLAFRKAALGALAGIIGIAALCLPKMFTGATTHFSITPHDHTRGERQG